MVFDSFCVLLYLMAIIKGIQRGLIRAAFSFIGFLMALIVSKYFSGYVAEWIKDNTYFNGKWLFPLAFLILFIGILLLVRVIAKSIAWGLELAMLGWFDKLGGVLFYLLLYTLVLCSIHYIILLIPGIAALLSDSYFSPFMQDIISWKKHFVE